MGAKMSNGVGNFSFKNSPMKPSFARKRIGPITKSVFKTMSNLAGGLKLKVPKLTTKSSGGANRRGYAT